MQKFINITKAYGIFVLSIAIWWALAFSPSSVDQTLRNELFAHHKPASSSHDYLYEAKLSSITRDDLKQALGGDFDLMAKMISDWDIDARVLEIKYQIKAKRLPADDFLRSQTLIRLINSNTSSLAASEFHRLSARHIIDDAGADIDLTRSYRRFIPQTYAAANFLLALVPPEQIVALPPLLREQTQLHPKELTDKIPLDIDRQNSEKLFQAQPDIAFVAHYSLPATIQALANQGITLYMMKDLTTVEAIGQELSNIGAITQRPLHSDLMKLFIDAAFRSFDNRLLTLEHFYRQKGLEHPKFMMLSYHNGFSVPTKKTLTGQILARMAPFDTSLSYSQANDPVGGWSATIDKEKLLNIDPNCLIITTENASAVAREFGGDKALQMLSAVKNNKIFFVDDAVQNSPSQYAVLAYFDLVHCLEMLP